METYKRNDAVSYFIKLAQVSKEHNLLLRLNISYSSTFQKAPRIVFLQLITQQ